MIVVTGATGHLGRLVIDELLRRGIAASQVVAAVRNPDSAADIAERGVRVQAADYTEPSSLDTALAGADKVLLISANLIGQRVPQHRNVVQAAVRAGVGLLAYTSILNADTTGIGLAAEHKATEDLIRDSGLSYAMLRNSWYTENYTANLASTLANGVLLGSAGDGRVGAVPRADYAAAAAAVLTAESPDQVYELAADEGFTMTEYAAEVARASGRPVAYQDLPAADYIQALVGFGLDEGYAGALADADLGIARGELASDSRDLSRLIGRPTTSLADAVAAGLKALVV